MADLIGRTTAGGWVIVEKIKFPPDHTGGYFSESFFVERGKERAFLKLMDITNFGDLQELLAGLAGFSYETKLISHTTDRGLSRVVNLLESGELEVDPGNPIAVLRRLPYLVFERGVGDIRRTVDVSAAVSEQWRFCVLHKTAAGLLQLHQANIAHQDLKPSNVIQIADDNLKLGDLGRSSMRGNAAPHDGLSVAGAHSYAPFELTYSYVLPDWIERRIATDVFHMGCLAVFVFTNIVLPAAVYSRLEPAYQPGTWGDSYEGVVPHLKAALARTLAEISNDFPVAFRHDLSALVADMCNPDPLKRGSGNKSGSSIGTTLWLQKYVSRFDLLEKRSRMNSKISHA